MEQRITNASIESNYLSIIRRHVKVRILVDEFFKDMKNSGENFLTKRMRKKKESEVVESNGGINKFSDCSFNNDSQFERLNSSKVFEHILSKFGLLFEGDF